ncbi:unnamed protein product, partial [Symbiodinium natans]
MPHSSKQGYQISALQLLDADISKLSAHLCALCACQELVLDLNSNQLGKEGAAALAQALERLGDAGALRRLTLMLRINGI